MLDHRAVRGTLTLLAALWRPAADRRTRSRQRLCAIGLALLMVVLRQQFGEWG